MTLCDFCLSTYLCCLFLLLLSRNVLIFTVVVIRFAFIYCCHRITEQHSREVSEMDHLLQEELQQARANQQQNVSETH